MDELRNLPLLSVIVPVYKVEAYLDDCLESIINQTYKNLEIILVDDGSPDKCPQICDFWATKDSRIKVIHQKNQGLSGARNSGLSLASGDFIAFVDSDDWLDLQCYEKTVLKALDTGADIVCYDIFEVVDKNIKIIPHLPCFESEEATFYAKEKLPLLCSLWPLVWAKLYRASFIRNNNLKFIEGFLYEDNPFVLGCWIRNPLVSIVNEHLHYYRMARVGQITSDGNKNTKDVFKIMDFIFRDFEDKGTSKN